MASVRGSLAADSAAARATCPYPSLCIRDFQNFDENQSPLIWDEGLLKKMHLISRKSLILSVPGVPSNAERSAARYSGGPSPGKGFPGGGYGGKDMSRVSLSKR